MSNIREYDDSIRIYVDADACPVKEEITEIAQRHHVDIFFIASYAHVRTEPTLSADHWVYVDAQSEEVDLYIVNHVCSGDIVVTQDGGLASLLLARDVYVLTPRGKWFLEGEMDALLQQRYVSGKNRRAGMHAKGPRKMSEADRRRFSEQLQRFLSAYEGKPS